MSVTLHSFPLFSLGVSCHIMSGPVCANNCKYCLRAGWYIREAEAEGGGHNGVCGFRSLGPLCSTKRAWVLLFLA